MPFFPFFLLCPRRALFSQPSENSTRDEFPSFSRKTYTLFALLIFFFYSFFMRAPLPFFPSKDFLSICDPWQLETSITSLTVWRMVLPSFLVFPPPLPNPLTYPRTVPKPDNKPFDCFLPLSFCSRCPFVRYSPFPQLFPHRSQETRGPSRLSSEVPSSAVDAPLSLKVCLRF